MSERTDTGRRLGCYREGDVWRCYSAADLEALLRLTDDGRPVELVDGGEGES